MSALPCDCTVSSPGAASQNTSHSPAAVSVERSLRNATNWVGSSVPPSQESHRAFPSSSALLTNPCSSLYHTLMSLSGLCSCLSYQPVSYARNMSQTMRRMFLELKALAQTSYMTHLLPVTAYISVCCQLVFEVAFNSARGGYVAIDDISFSPEFCHTDTGERGRARHHRLIRPCVWVAARVLSGRLLNALHARRLKSSVAATSCNVNYCFHSRSVGLMQEDNDCICSSLRALA